MLRILPVRCTGLIHDLVEGAARGKGGAQPSGYNMNMIFTVMYTAAVFLIQHFFYRMLKYKVAVSGSDKGFTAKTLKKAHKL